MSRRALRGGDREPVWRRAGRELFDRFERAVASSSLSTPTSVAAAAALGAARARLAGRWPASAEIAALFGTPPRASRRIAVRIGALEAKNRLTVRRLAGSSLAPFASLVRWHDPRTTAALRPPVILVTAHFGALHLLAAALDQLAGSRLVLRWSPLHVPGPRERIASTSGGPESRANALREAIRELRDGNFVLTLLDGEHGAGTVVTVLDRPARFGSGAFLLARYSKVPILPVVARWVGTRVVCELGRPVSGADEAARWLEKELRQDPAQATLGLVRQLLFEPALESTEAGFSLR